MPLVIGLCCLVEFIIPLPAADREPSLAPGGDHPLGTDPYGHDVLLLVSRAAIRSGGVAAWATGVTTLLAITIGVIAARRPLGMFDTLQTAIARVLDGLGPFVIAACVFTLIQRLDIWLAGAVLAAFVWPSLSGIVRGEAIMHSKSTYVEALRAIGASPLRITVFHLLPAMVDRLLPPCAALIGAYIGLFGALGFIGVGVTTELNLGFIVFDGMQVMHSQPWYFWSGVGAFVAVLGIVAMGAAITTHLLGGTPLIHSSVKLGEA
ncbi:MAG: ABC transporter permease subunit [Planctomycetes bacterium]|nr:ABC transporter permease subunit [Planctomycetota bacterium]